MIAASDETSLVHLRVHHRSATPLRCGQRRSGYPVPCRHRGLQSPHRAPVPGRRSIAPSHRPKKTAELQDDNKLRFYWLSGLGHSRGTFPLPRGPALVRYLHWAHASHCSRRNAPGRVPRPPQSRPLGTTPDYPGHHRSFRLEGDEVRGGEACPFLSRLCHL